MIPCVDDLTTKPIPGNRSKARVVNCMAGFCGCARVIVHNMSFVNMYRGVVERVLYVLKDGVLCATPKPCNGFAGMSDFRRRLVSSLTPTTVLSPMAFAETYHGRKLIRYINAAKSLGRRGLRKRDAQTSFFVKAEKVILKPGKEDPCPRIIQPRSYRYNVCIGRFLKLFEKELFAGLARVAGYRCVFKGMNAEETALEMHNHWKEFSDPIAIGLDASRFDQHVSREALEYEHGVYNSVFQSESLRKWCSVGWSV